MGYYTNRKRTKKSHTRKTIVIGIIAAVLIAGLAYAALAYRQNKHNKQTAVTPTTTSAAQGESKIDMNPATPEEKKESEQQKDTIVAQQKNETSNTTPASGNVTPIISYAEQYGNTIEAAAFVSTIIEDGGTCTFTATLGTNKVTRQVTAVRNAKNTTCPTFTVPRSEFKSAGTWSVIVNYSSTAHNGSSTSKSMEVK